MPHYLLDSVFMEMLLFLAIATLLVVSIKGLLRWHDLRIAAAALAQPSKLRRAWVSDSGDDYARACLWATDGHARYELARQHDIPAVLACLQAAGVLVEDVPAWCQDTTLPVPCENFGYRLVRIIGEYVSPILVVSVVLETLLHLFL